jgi:hypothetical protein
MFGYMLAGFFQVNISHSADGCLKREARKIHRHEKIKKRKKKISRKKGNFFSFSSLPFHIRYKSFFGLYKYMNIEEDKQYNKDHADVDDVYRSMLYPAAD